MHGSIAGKLKSDGVFAKSSLCIRCRSAAQTGLFCYLLYLFSANVETFFAKQPTPDQYTARNISVAIKTIVTGLTYLLTFIFGANTLGLSGEGHHQLMTDVWIMWL